MEAPTFELLKMSNRGENLEARENSERTINVLEESRTMGNDTLAHDGSMFDNLFNIVRLTTTTTTGEVGENQPTKFEIMPKIMASSSPTNLERRNIRT